VLLIMAGIVMLAAGDQNMLRSVRRVAQQSIENLRSSKRRSDGSSRELYLRKYAVVITCIDRKAARVGQHDTSSETARSCTGWS
jgi:hypothetical protein